jgi:hypothetical protein
MANTVNRNVVSIRRFDEASAKGAKVLERKPDESVTSTALVTLLRDGGC